MIRTLVAHNKKSRINHARNFLFFLLLYGLIVFALAALGNQKFERLHLLFDTSIGILSLLLALFLLAEQNHIQQNVRNYLVIALGFSSFTELLHALMGIEWAGEFAWVATYANFLRPATWPPSTYVLPVTVLWAIWLMRRKSTLSTGAFAAGVGAITFSLYLLSFNLPSYVDTGLLGIQRPTQIPVLFLLLIFIAACWRERHKSMFFEGMAWMGVFLFLSDSFMLYSTSPHEKFTMMAHAGKFMAYIFLHVVQMKMSVEAGIARKDAESNLLQEKQHLQQAMDELVFQEYALNQHSIVGVTDVQGKIIYANDSFCEISGYSRAELMGKNHRILNSGKHSEEFFREMYRTIASGKVWQGEICNRAKDGHLYWVKTSIVPFMGDQGKSKQYVSLRTDITERKRVESELLRYQEHLEELVEEQIIDLKHAKDTAEAASLAKSNFLANMSHEIRTPMNGVVGIVDILQESNLTPEQQRLVNTIRVSSMALLGILGDILDFSKIEAGKLEVEIISVNLRELVEGVAQLLAPTVADKDIELIAFVDPAIPDWVLTDPGRLRQILFNLLGNAVKFSRRDTQHHGQVLLRVEKKVSTEGREVMHFRVIDNGIGMTAETIAQLFTPFVQADTTTTRRFGGTGLGLSISKHLTELLHGKIDAQSSFGAGSEFSVTLPLEMAPPGHSRAELSELSGMHILIVTDHPVYAEILTEYLRAVSAKVILCATQEAALASIQQGESHDLVLLIEMTRSSSFDSEISRLLKKHSPTLPVVHLVSRRIGDIPANELTVSANPLLFDELANMLVIASRKGEVRDVVQKSERRSRVRKLVPSMEEAVARNELILVAEDNDVSREVIQEQLRILGYASVVAEDGQAALAKWRSGHFSLLLTDCHMPYLDGFGLTAAIRKEEHSEKRLRIIAVTGNAMQGEAQRCIACGMDDYLAKPLRLSDLGAKLARWLPQKELEVSPAPVSTTRQATVAAPANSDSDTLWDNGTLTRMVGDNPDMHRRLLNKFVSGTEEHIAAIITAAAAGDLDTVSGIAHKMKSAARTVGALRLGNICQKLEVTAKLRDVNVIATCTAELESGFSEVTSVINKLN